MSVIQSIREKICKVGSNSYCISASRFYSYRLFPGDRIEWEARKFNNTWFGEWKKIDYISFETKLKARDDQQQAAAQQQQQRIYRSTKTPDGQNKCGTRKWKKFIMTSRI